MLNLYYLERQVASYHREQQRGFSERPRVGHPRARSLAMAHRLSSALHRGASRWAPGAWSLSHSTRGLLP